MAVVAESGLVRNPPRDAEVGQVDVVGAVRPRMRIDEHVGRLHVAMHETARMCGIQGTRDLRDDADRVRRIEVGVLQTSLQIAPFHVPHRDEEEVVSRPGLVDGDDVRVVNRGGELRLAQKADSERLVLGEARRE